MTLLVATGNHRRSTPAELNEMAGETLCRRLRIVNHDCEDPAGLVLLGHTQQGLPVEVNRLVVESDLTVLTGIITPHQTAGYSGGRKSIMPGVAGIRSLQQHHSFPIRSAEPIMGQLAANPFHEEAVAAARLVGVDFIVNVVKNTAGKIVGVVAGDLEEAHAAGVEICARAWVVRLEQPADITLVTPGGYPKDIDMHQAQKAVAAAERVTRRGGPVILVAECRDGAGKFARALMEASSPEEVITRFHQEGFSAGEHTSKAYMWARALSRHPLILVTGGVPRAALESMFCHWAPTVEEALALAQRRGGGDRLVVVPHACDCILEVTKSLEE